MKVGTWLNTGRGGWWDKHFHKRGESKVFSNHTHGLLGHIRGEENLAISQPIENYSKDIRITVNSIIALRRQSCRFQCCILSKHPCQHRGRARCESCPGSCHYLSSHLQPHPVSSSFRHISCRSESSNK